ncbi:MAG: beta-lactamase family protein [Gemmatimonadetes bacterium]|nr:beta-lactamase family protein [Gemmatimonadota bacterium]
MRSILWFVAVPSVLAAQVPAEFAAARRTIDSLMAAHRLPSVAVAVARDGRVVWETAFGLADREKNIAATAQTAYSLASISKPFTATGLMKLVEKGRVSLDRPLNDYLGAAKVRAFEGKAAQATVQHVLTHTAGLPLHYQFFYRDGGYPVPTTDETIRRFGILTSRPGGGYQYSNLGFGLLDYVIRRQGGLGYADYMRREVFDPLGLTHTSVGPRAGLEAETAARYTNEDQPIPYYTFDHPGASEVYASAHDLVRFGMFHLGNAVEGQQAVLSPETRTRMQRDVAVEGPGLTRGLGWAIRADEFGYRRISHTGGMPGVTTMLALYPQANVVVVVLLNKSQPAAMVRIAQELAAAVLPGYDAKLREALARPAVAPPVADWTSLVGRWRGYVRSYADSLPVEFSVAPTGPHNVRVGGVMVEKPEATSWVNGVFVMTTTSPLTAPDIKRHPHVLSFALRPRGDTLSGYAAASSGPPQAQRLYYALSSYARVVKERVARPSTLPRQGTR